MTNAPLKLFKDLNVLWTNYAKFNPVYERIIDELPATLSDSYLRCRSSIYGHRRTKDMMSKDDRIALFERTGINHCVHGVHLAMECPTCAANHKHDLENPDSAHSRSGEAKEET